MWIFLWIFLLFAILLFGKISLRISSVRKGFFLFRLQWLGIPLYQTVLFFHFKRHIRPEIIQVKHYHFRRIYQLHFERKSKERQKKKKSCRLKNAVFSAMQMQIRQFDLKIGVENAAITAFLSEIMRWFLCFLCKRKRIKCVEKIQIFPAFQQQVFSLHLDCIITIRLADIIYIICKKKRRI